MCTPVVPGCIRYRQLLRASRPAGRSGTARPAGGHSLYSGVGPVLASLGSTVTPTGSGAVYLSVHVHLQSTVICHLQHVVIIPEADRVTASGKPWAGHSYASCSRARRSSRSSRAAACRWLLRLLLMARMRCRGRELRSSGAALEKTSGSRSTDWTSRRA